MATIYTDESREQRYARLRTKKRKCEKALDILMWITLLVGAFDLIPGLFSGLFNGLFGGSLDNFFAFFFSFAGAAAAIYAIYAKKFFHTLAAIVFIAVISVLGAAMAGQMAISTGYIVILIPVAVIDRIWNGLEKEEGFPLFDISYAEREERRRNQEKLTEVRMLRAGYRVAADEQPADMHDLLDSERDVPVMPAHPRGYHDRFLGSAAVSAPAAAVPSGIMDTLEEIGAQQPAENAAPAPLPAPASDAVSAPLPVLEALDTQPVTPGRAADAARPGIREPEPAQN